MTSAFRPRKSGTSGSKKRSPARGPRRVPGSLSSRRAGQGAKTPQRTVAARASLRLVVGDQRVPRRAHQSKEDASVLDIRGLEKLFPGLGKPATGPLRLLATRPDIVRYLADLEKFPDASITATPDAIARIRREAGITDPESPAARATDAACLLGYLAALSDAVLALHFMMKAGTLPKNEKMLRELDIALNHATLWSLLTTLDAATKAKKPPVETLFTSLLPRPKRTKQ